MLNVNSSFTKPRLFPVIVGAVFLAVVAFLTIEPGRWNRPSATKQTIDTTAYRDGGIYSYTLQCTCPPYLIEGSNAGLPFALHISWLNKPTPPLFPSGGAVVVSASGTKFFNGNAAKGAEPSSEFQVVIPDPLLPSGTAEMTVAIPLEIVGVKPDLSALSFSVYRKGDSLASVQWPITARQSFHDFVMPYLYGLAVLFLGVGIWVAGWYQMQRLQQRTEERLRQAQERVADNPQQARFAWDLARVKLEAYFDRNLIQVNLVFWVATAVMGAGFCFVLVGVWLAYRQPHELTPTLVAACSGIITQFIGATFMVIYRSIMAQANDFMTVLERINSVGMAVQVLDSLQDGTTLKDSTRAQIATLLLGKEVRSHSAVPSLASKKGDAPD